MWRSLLLSIVTAAAAAASEKDHTFTGATQMIYHEQSNSLIIADAEGLWRLEQTADDDNNGFGDFNVTTSELVGDPAQCRPLYVLKASAGASAGAGAGAGAGASASVHWCRACVQPQVRPRPRPRAGLCTSALLSA